MAAPSIRRDAAVYGGQEARINVLHRSMGIISGLAPWRLYWGPYGQPLQLEWNWYAAMSRAFVKEQEDASVEELPDRLISEHANLVTPEGLKQIEAEVRRLSAAHAEAQAAEDRERVAAIARDLRYWTARATSAEVVTPAQSNTHVHFASTVTIARDDGRRQTFRIVGEDEAEPAKGTIPYVSPLARALSGRAVGDVVRVGDGDVEVLDVK